MSMMLTVIVALSVVSYMGSSNIKESTDEIATNWLPSVAAAGDLENAFFSKRLDYARHVLSLSAEDIEAGDIAVSESRAMMEEAIKSYVPFVASEKERTVLAELQSAIASYDGVGETLMALSRENKNVEATQVFKGPMKLEADKVEKLIDELVALNLAGSAAAVKSSDLRFDNTVTLIISVVVFATVISILGIVYVLKRVSTPIQQITTAMRKLAEGDSTSEIPFSGRTDEIGDMAAAVEVFRQNAIKNELLEQEAAESRSATEAGQIAEQRRIAREAEQLRVATSALGESLQRLANGDLTCRIDAQFASEYEPLRNDFNATLAQLDRTIRAIANAVQNMDDGTREISEGASDLSKRTEQQAASLEETAAAMEQITSNVVSSTKMTEEARSRTQSANTSASQSAVIVSRAEEAMERIEQSSQQISNILGVIDEIAFQTNLLALNAGVEAARAGEAGRGFAVVAQEVRELAQRSAQAAKQIKELIEKSSIEVGSGVALVRDTGISLKTISNSISEVNDFMKSIAMSAQEQSTGLSQVNIAVNQMDQMTQQNAAMVEQSSAATTSLSLEAVRLRDLISQFNLDGRLDQARAQNQTNSAGARVNMTDLRIVRSH